MAPTIPAALAGVNTCWPWPRRPAPRWPWPRRPAPR